MVKYILNLFKGWLALSKKMALKSCLLAMLCFGLVSCANFWTSGDDLILVDNQNQENSSVELSQYNDMASPNELARIYNKRVPPLNNLIVCRSRQCAPAELSMSREYIFNSLAHIIDNNLDATALLCEANPQAHVCINPYITVPAKVGVTPAYVYFDGVKIVDASIEPAQTALKLVLLYNLSYNGQTPFVCKPDTSMLYVKSNNNVVLNGDGFQCDMTSVGMTQIRIMFNVDYIDLDYGYIGGYYSVGLSGPANGGGSGYGLIRLPEDTYPLNPQLLIQNEDKKDNVALGAQPLSENEVKETEKPVENEKNSVQKNVSNAEVVISEPSKEEENIALNKSEEGDDVARELVVTSERAVLRAKEKIKSSPAQVIDVNAEVETVENVAPENIDGLDEVFQDDLDDYIK